MTAQWIERWREHRRYRRFLKRQRQQEINRALLRRNLVRIGIARSTWDRPDGGG